MKKLYFYINGSGSPFWLDEKKDIHGNNYYWDLFYPANPSEKFKNEWDAIRTLFYTYQNPIDRNFPSFWTESMCNLFNNLVSNFLTTATFELPDYNLINKYLPIQQDGRLNLYQKDILKQHLGLNSHFDNKHNFEIFLNNKLEIESVQIVNLPFYEPFKINQIEFYAYNTISLTFDKYTNFQINLCPFTNNTYLTNINTGGHGAIFLAVRIDRNDILSNPEKLFIQFDKLW